MTTTTSTTTNASGKEAVRVAILFNRYLPFNEELSQALGAQLSADGFQVLPSPRQRTGVSWARELSRQLTEADAVIPFISPGAEHSEMLLYQLELVHESAQSRKGRLLVLPVRVKGEGPLPESLAHLTDPAYFKVWSGPQDTGRLAREVAQCLGEFATGAARPLPKSKPGLPGTLTIEPTGGAVALGSSFYIERGPDEDLREAIARNDSIVLLKGARQMGKTSMLARGLQFAREHGARAAFTDFQKLGARDLENASSFYLALAESLADQLDFPVAPQDAWDARRGPNANFDRYIRREVLGKMTVPLVWGLDEVDRLFAHPFGSEVFGLLRSWHNERALDPSGPWAGLTLVIAYATEAHLFITDLNQSPFNVGTRLALEDFTTEQVAELNRRHGSPLKSESDIDRLVQLVAGNPFLVRTSLHVLATQNLTLEQFEAEADHDEGLFGDHLRRILVLLAKDPGLLEVVRGVLNGQPCPDQESFWRLRSAGIMAGHGPNDAWPRCQLYAKYLSRHLLV